MTDTTNTTAAKHYAKRDPESQGTHYINHVYAMATEGLHATRRTSQLAHSDIEIERLRAALASPAQAVPAPGAPRDPSITLDFKMATELLKMFGEEPGLVTLQQGSERSHSGTGIYALYSHLPEEGAEFLGAEPDNKAMPEPSPVQAVPASVIMASVMRDDGGEHPAFCLMVAYRAEKDAMTALAMLTDEPAQQAAPDMTDAYAGAREDLSIWKKRALEAEALNRKFAASVNSPSFMGEPAALAQAGEYPPLVCDYCGALTPDPWHSSGMLHGKMSKHIHSCDACAARGAAQSAPVDATMQQDAERWQFFADYMVSTRTDLDDEIVGCDSVQKMARVLDAARAAQEGKHD